MDRIFEKKLKYYQGNLAPSASRGKWYLFPLADPEKFRSRDLENIAKGN
jgi:hypothetical protein